MFTVKWMYEKAGGAFERIFAAETVDAAFDQRGVSPQTPSTSPLDLCGRTVLNGLVVLDGHNLYGPSFDCGKIYVMNDSGSTVASYDLGPVDKSVGQERMANPPPMGA